MPAPIPGPTVLLSGCGGGATPGSRKRAIRKCECQAAAAWSVESRSKFPPRAASVVLTNCSASAPVADALGLSSGGERLGVGAVAAQHCAF